MLLLKDDCNFSRSTTGRRGGKMPALKQSNKFTRMLSVRSYNHLSTATSRPTWAHRTTVEVEVEIETTTARSPSEADLSRAEVKMAGQTCHREPPGSTRESTPTRSRTSARLTQTTSRWDLRGAA